MTFAERVYAVTKTIPCGKISTYKEIAHALDCRAYRAVGNALNKNPYAPVVPCHRVISSNGALGGFAHGAKQKKKMLENEGIIILNDHIDINRFLYKIKKN